MLGRKCSQGRAASDLRGAQYVTPTCCICCKPSACLLSAQRRYVSRHRSEDDMLKGVILQAPVSPAAEGGSIRPAAKGTSSTGDAFNECQTAPNCHASVALPPLLGTSPGVQVYLHLATCCSALLDALVSLHSTHTRWCTIKGLTRHEGGHCHFCCCCCCAGF